MACELKACRSLLYAAIATAWSVGDVSHFGSMMGRSSGFAEARVTVPRERGATMAARMVAYCSSQLILYEA